MPEEKWKERLDRLPVQLVQITGGGVNPGECIEGITKDAKFIGSRDWLPMVGVNYHFSFSGSNRGREKLIEQISVELGRPESFDRTQSRLWHYYWSLQSTEIPETKVHKTLGRTRIREICQSFGLNEEDERIINDLLAVYAMYIGFDELRAKYDIVRLSDLESDRRGRIIRALLQINLESARRRALDQS